MQETHDWLAQNRFTSYVSLFANYTGADLLRLTRRDLIELCGAADGIRLFNTLRSRTVKVVYITMGQEKGVFLPFKVNVNCLFHVLCTNTGTKNYIGLQMDFPSIRADGVP